MRIGVKLAYVKSKCGKGNPNNQQVRAPDKSSYRDMAELVDASDLEFGGLVRVGSSPTIPTKYIVY